MLTDDEIRKAAESAAEQMWPESGYVGWTDDDSEFHRLFLEACIAKLTAGVDVPEPVYMGCDGMGDIFAFDEDQLLQYGDVRALAAREQAIEECAAECLSQHENGNYKHDTREDCYDAIRALAASPQEQI